MIDNSYEIGLPETESLQDASEFIRRDSLDAFQAKLVPKNYTTGEGMAKELFSVISLLKPICNFSCFGIKEQKDVPYPKVWTRAPICTNYNQFILLLLVLI